MRLQQQTWNCGPGLIFVAIVAAAIAAGGCRTVRPWEKAKLSGYLMREDRDPLSDSFAEHVYFTREAASGGGNVGGGGCGCN